MLSDLFFLFAIIVSIIYGILSGTAMRNVAIIRTLLEQQNELLETHTKLLAATANALNPPDGERRRATAKE
jgi:hypothetical protein